MLGKDGQQKGTDLREKRKTRLPFSPSPFWKPFNGNTQSPRSGSFIFKMAAMLQIPRVFPRVSCRGSAKAVQCPCPGPKIGDKSQQIPRYSPVCPRGHPPGMAADKCIMFLQVASILTPSLAQIFRRMSAGHANFRPFDCPFLNQNKTNDSPLKEKVLNCCLWLSLPV